MMQSEGLEIQYQVWNLKFLLRPEVTRFTQYRSDDLNTQKWTEQCSRYEFVSFWKRRNLEHLDTKRSLSGAYIRLFYVRLCQWRRWSLTIANSLHSKTIPMATPHERIVRILITVFPRECCTCARAKGSLSLYVTGRLATFSCRQSRERNRMSSHCSH